MVWKAVHERSRAVPQQVGVVVPGLDHRGDVPVSGRPNRDQRGRQHESGHPSQCQPVVTARSADQAGGVGDEEQVGVVPGHLRAFQRRAHRVDGGRSQTQLGRQRAEILGPGVDEIDPGQQLWIVDQCGDLVGVEILWA
jgi:hypothetical protein